MNTKLSAALDSGEQVVDFKISPDGQWVVYRAGIPNTAVPPSPPNGRLWLYSVPIDGGMPARIDASLFVTNGVADYAISPNGPRVVYLTVQNVAEKMELYSVPIAGPAGSDVKLNGALPPGGNVEGTPLAFLISPDGSRVLYRANQESSTRFDLYGVPVGGPASEGLRINDLSQANGVLSVGRISPDNQWVVYRAERDPNPPALFSVPISGPPTESVELSGPMTAGAFIYWMEISPDSSRVVYTADQETEDMVELYSVPIRGPSNLGIGLNRMNMAAGADTGGDLYNRFLISPNSQRVTYFETEESQAGMGLYGVPIGGTRGGGRRINPFPSPTLYLNERVLLFSPDSSRVIYYESPAQSTAVIDTGQIYSTPVDGPATASIPLNQPLVSGGSVWPNPQIASGAGRVVYMADQDSDDVYELYSVPVAGPASQGIKLSGSLGFLGDVQSFKVSPDGQSVAYVADRVRSFSGDDDFKLYRRPVAGTAFSVLMNGPLVEGGDVSPAYEFTPDGTRIVYIADQDSDGVNELYVSEYKPAAAQHWRQYR